MVQGYLWALDRILQLHPILVFLMLFVVPIATGYWFFALRPYLRGSAQDMLSPWHVRRPVVPGVLERYAAWEWATESRLTPFGHWLVEELERQHLSLGELARQAVVEQDAVITLLYTDARRSTDWAMIRRLAVVLGAGAHQIERLVRVEVAAEADAGKTAIPSTRDPRPRGTHPWQL